MSSMKPDSSTIATRKCERLDQTKNATPLTDRRPKRRRDSGSGVELSSRQIPFPSLPSLPFAAVV
jgi:hypothetical protein